MIERLRNAMAHLGTVLGRVVELSGRPDSSQRSSAELEEWKRRYEAFVRASGQILYEGDIGGNRLIWAGNVERILGYPVGGSDGLSRWIMSSWIEIIHPDDREQFQEAFSRALSAKDPFHVQYRVRKKDGSYIAVEDNGYFFEYGVDASSHIVGFVADITERKRLEEEFRQAQKMEAVGQLAGGIAHDFNNLLTVIIGRSELLKYRLEPEHPLRQQVDLIHETALRAQALTQQLLAFGRKQILQPKVLDLNAVVAKMVPLLRRLIREDIELVIVPRSERGHMEADPGQIGQVIMNLVVNARDAMPEGGQLTLETANVELDAAAVRVHGAQPGSYVMLAVGDTGMGMDAETQARLFEPFFTTKEPGKGTGLGLATVYGIVKQSNGFIVVESAVGHGARFEIYLPRVKDPIGPVEHREAIPWGRRGLETILLVEDEEGVRSLARARTGRSPGAPPPGHEGPLHLGLRRRRHRSPRRVRLRCGVSLETFRTGRARA